MYYSSDEDDEAECCLKGLICYASNYLLPEKNIPKEIFKPPPQTYSIGTDTEGKQYMMFNDKYLGMIYESWKERIECSTASTRRGSEIVCMLFRPAPDAKSTVIYSHGNRSDIGADLPFCLRLGLLVDSNVFTYDYSGYGASTGTPSQKNVLADIECAWDQLKARYGVLEERSVLYGRGLGAVPTIELAAKKKPAGVILLSPMTSAKDLAIRYIKAPRISKHFLSIYKLSKVTSPILVVHGVNDRIINMSHSVSICKMYPALIDPFWVEGAGHEDIQFNIGYLKRMRNFVIKDLGVIESKESLKKKIDLLKSMHLYI